jgi:putative ABC transport system permease protein
MPVLHELRQSFRALRREPGFAAIAILSVALGIGANTAIFSVVNGTLLRPLPFTQPDRLVSIRAIIPAIAQTYPTIPVSAPHFLEFRERATSFESLSAIHTGSTALTGAGEPEQLDAARVSANLFNVLGVSPRLGRGFLAEEDQQPGHRVAVITDSLWRRRFHADPSVIGRAIHLDQDPYTVIGVLPGWFRFPGANLLPIGGQMASSKPEIFRPLAFEASELAEFYGCNYAVLARLKPHASAQSATSELNVIIAQALRRRRESSELRAVAAPILDSMVGKTRRALFVLLGAVGAVLLIICVNLANLMLTRADRRSRECAIRTALGASRRRIVWSALSETMLISLAGGLLGVAFASAGLGALMRNAPVDLPRLEEVGIDPIVLLFAFALTTLTGVLFGLAPAWRSARADPQDSLRSGGRTATGTAGSGRMRAWLVAGQVGVSVMLLIAAALLARSFVQLMRTDPGFHAASALAADVRVPWNKYDAVQRVAFYKRVVDDLSSRPGVASAALVTMLPLQGEMWIDTFSLPGDTRKNWELPSANIRFASPEYFRTMGIPLIAGRTFSENDRSREVAIVSAKLAEALWPGQDPVGRRVWRHRAEFEVVGVAGDVRAEPHKPAAAIFYLPYWVWAPYGAAPRRMVVVARSEGDPRAVAGAFRAAVRAADPEVPAPAVHTMTEVLEQSVAQRRFQMLLISAFGGTALLLAGLGIYGVVSYTMARRRNEVGVRLALGARPKHIYAVAARQVLKPVALGMLAGFAGALATGRVLAALLYEISPRDPLTMTGVAVLLLAVTLAACLVPARRATRQDPLTALRHE